MLTALMVSGSVLGYITAALGAARFRYQRIRPWTEPLACIKAGSCAEGRHWRYKRDSDRGCFRRWGAVDTVNDALCNAAAVGLFWPFLLGGLCAIIGFTWVVTTNRKPLLPEITAKNMRDDAALKREGY